MKGFKLFVKRAPSVSALPVPATKSGRNTAKNKPAGRSGPQKFGKPGTPKDSSTGRPIKKTTKGKKGL
jgi:hypothetical protein